MLEGTCDRAPRCPSAGTLRAEEKGPFSHLRRDVGALPPPVFLRGDPKSWRAAPTPCILRRVREGPETLGPNPSEDTGLVTGSLAARWPACYLPLLLLLSRESSQWTLPCPAVGSDRLCFLWGAFWQPLRQLAEWAEPSGSLHPQVPAQNVTAPGVP